MAKQDGVERVLDAQFDAVRAYIRHPRKAERWPFAQFVAIAQGIAPDLMLYLARHSGAEIVALGIAKAAIFAVDLFASNRLGTWAENELPPGYSLIGVEKDLPREARQKDARQYRLSIEIDP